jgi:3-mercaptopyruvate sulfurtransferase SseA
MRKLAAVAIASTFVAGLAAAQMKVPAKQQPQTSTSPVQILMNTPQQAAAAEPAPESARRVPRAEAIKLVKENKAIFVDVRSKESYVAEHIKGALSFPLSDLPARMGELPKNKMIITYCA